jgi:hypothetical protein
MESNKVICHNFSNLQNLRHACIEVKITLHYHLKKGHLNSWKQILKAIEPGEDGHLARHVSLKTF